MIYHLSGYLQQYISFFNVVHYVSFRAMAALLTSLILSIIIGDWFIDHSKRLFRARSREHTPENHRQKDNMPTMGGVFVVIVVFLTSLLWCDLTSPEVWIMLLCLLGFGAIGFWDDWCKIKKKTGISAALKFRLQLIISTLVTILWLVITHASTTIIIPFFKNLTPDLGLLFIPWAVFIIIGASNAVNLTDGLDGLAIGSLIVNFGTFSIIAYAAGHYHIAHYLHIPYAGTAQLAIIGTTLMGASLGFLWYNSYPAQIFMGDVGSLALGSVLALMALMVKQELLLVIAGGLFVTETISVIIQVMSYKYFGKRVFKMAPIHHHFELLGWPEAKITMRFGIISLVLCLIALMTLKIR